MRVNSRLGESESEVNVGDAERHLLTFQHHGVIARCPPYVFPRVRRTPLTDALVLTALSMLGTCNLTVTPAFVFDHSHARSMAQTFDARFRVRFGPYPQPFLFDATDVGPRSSMRGQGVVSTSCLPPHSQPRLFDWTDVGPKPSMQGFECGLVLPTTTSVLCDSLGLKPSLRGFECGLVLPTTTPAVACPSPSFLSTRSEQLCTLNLPGILYPGNTLAL